AQGALCPAARRPVRRARIRRRGVMTAPFHEGVVLARQELTPGMVRVTFGGEGLAALVSTGVPDEYFRFFFPDPRTGRLHLPRIEADGRWSFPEGRECVRYATYTVRRYRRMSEGAVEIDVDFVVHKGGIASEWAQKAKPGETLVLNRPRGIYSPPADTAWQLLVADATGLPALGRILEQTPETMSSRVFVEVAEPNHQQDLPAHPGATVTWIARSGNGVAPSRLAEIVRSFPMPETPGYIWVAGEQKVVRATRKYVRHTLKLPPERYELVSYWTHEG